MSSADRPGIFDRAETAASALRARFPQSPEMAVVLGSGLDAFAQQIHDPKAIPYSEIPHFPVPSVAGHGGTYVQGTVGNKQVAVLRGRFHYYEGHDLETVTLPVRVLHRLGTRTLILTAAVGGINDRFPPGQIMAVTDHLNLLGANPLRGPNDDRFGTRFPDMSAVYSRRLLQVASAAAQALDIPLAHGIYAAVPGPSYETPAEVRMLRVLGADVVGMSTAPEAIVARHGGLEVLALAVVSNAAAGLSETPLSHQEVLEAGQQAGPRLARLLTRVIENLDPSPSPPGPSPATNLKTSNRVGWMAKVAVFPHPSLRHRGPGAEPTSRTAPSPP